MKIKNNTAMQQPVIVIGMKHSGIPLVSELLSHAGIFMGNDLNENAESKLFESLNHWIFNQAGATWDNPYNFRFVDEAFTQAIASGILRHLKGHRLKPFLDSARRKYRKAERFDFDWGFGHPLNTFTLEVWKLLFDRPRVIHIHRNPLDVIAAMQQSNALLNATMHGGILKGMKRHRLERKLTNERIYQNSLRANDMTAAFELWKAYLEQAMSIEEKLNTPVHHISYERLLKDFSGETEALFRFLGFKIPDGTLLEVEAKIKKEKCYAFLKTNILNEFYQSIKNQSLMAELDYHAIV
jgi:hypothetical protein